MTDMKEKGNEKSSTQDILFVTKTLTKSAKIVATRTKGTVLVPSGMSKVLKYAGVTFSVAGLVIDGCNIVSALVDDVNVRKHAREIIKELEDAINKLEEKLREEKDEERRREIEDVINDLKIRLKHVKRCQVVPAKYMKTFSSAGGGLVAGMAGGSLGAWGGAQAGALFGLCFGPVGAAVGAPIGAIVGALGLGIGAGIGGSIAGEAAMELGLETFVDE